MFNPVLPDALRPDPGASPEAQSDPKPKRFHFRKGKTNPRRLAYLTLFLFAAPSDWRLLAIGIVLVSAAVFLHGWAAGYLARAGYVEREKILTVRGPYRHNRNPYYLAHLTMDLGVFFLAGLPLLYLLYFPVAYSVYSRWVRNEEKFLEEEFGDDYRAFKSEVPRWRFRLTPAPPRGREQSFEWSMFRLNRELPRSLSHLLVLSLFVGLFFMGNPLVQLDLLFRVTLIGAVAIWLVLHDIFPLDVSKVSIPWLLLAFVAASATAIGLTKVPVWEVWSGAAAWIAIAVGVLLGTLGAAPAVPGLPGLVGKKNDELFARPMSQWYVLSLGLGLISCTFGGVWVGITAPLTVWALGIAGVVPIRRISQSPIAGLGLVLLIAVDAGLAVGRLLG